MSGFLTELAYARVRDGTRPVNRLTSALHFASDIMKAVVVVPTGYRTDLGTVPRLPFAYLFFGNVGDEAAVIHDYLYESRQVPRKVADAVFAEALACMGVPAWQRGPMWLAVRTLGHKHYGTGSPVADVAAEKK